MTKIAGFQVLFLDEYCKADVFQFFSANFSYLQGYWLENVYNCILGQDNRPHMVCILIRVISFLY